MGGQQPRIVGLLDEPRSESNPVSAEDPAPYRSRPRSASRRNPHDCRLHCAVDVSQVQTFQGYIMATWRWLRAQRQLRIRSGGATTPGSLPPA